MDAMEIVSQPKLLVDRGNGHVEGEGDLFRGVPACAVLEIGLEPPQHGSLTDRQILPPCAFGEVSICFCPRPLEPAHGVQSVPLDPGRHALPCHQLLDQRPGRIF
jgi:hypothetical protein